MQTEVIKCKCCEIPLHGSEIYADCVEESICRTCSTLIALEIIDSEGHKLPWPEAEYSWRTASETKY
jgi:hypothetical protein